MSNENVGLHELIDGGFLSVGQELICPMREVEARVCSRGIAIGEQIYSDPTDAMRAVLGNHSAMDNGWSFWKLPDPLRNFVKPLEHVRIEYLAKASKDGVRTSVSHPLRIDVLNVPGVSGQVGLTLMPGKKGDALYGAPWDRNLELDLQRINAWGADIVLTLMEEHEFELLGVPSFKSVMPNQKFRWIHLEIRDSDVPDIDFESDWSFVREELVCLLTAGGKVLIHCRGGLGRTGMIAAGLLQEFGVSPESAIMSVRQVRPGAIETWEQEEYVRALRAG
jgi:protein-tyrosine phosphatase